MERTIIKPTQEELVEVIKNMPTIAEKEAWVFTFEPDEDSLFYSPEVMPENTELFQVNDETAVYLNDKKELKGVMMEYFDHNFAEHHEAFKGLKSKVFGNNKIKETVIDPNKDTREVTLIFKELFENTLIKEAVTKKH